MRAAAGNLASQLGARLRGLAAGGQRRAAPLSHSFSSQTTRRRQPRDGEVSSLAESQAAAAGAASPSSATLRDVEGRLGPLSHEPTVPPPRPLVVVISGPSGVGKDAVIRRLQEKRPDLYFVVTATSRSMRPGERDGVDYLFVGRPQFEAWIAEGTLLEHAVVYGEYKGIPRQQVVDALARNTDVVLRVDVQGAATVRRLLPGLVSVFLVAESEAELVQRLVARKTEPMDKMLLRVQTAKEETSHIAEFDYVVVNRDGQMEETVLQIEAILQAEKARVSRRLQGPAAEAAAGRHPDIQTIHKHNFLQQLPRAAAS